MGRSGTGYVALVVIFAYYIGNICNQENYNHYVQNLGN